MVYRVDVMVVQYCGGGWWTIVWRLWKFKEAGWTLEEVMVQGGGARFWGQGHGGSRMWIWIMGWNIL